MGIEDVQDLGDRTVISIYEPTPYGEEDRTRCVEVFHGLPDMPWVTREQLRSRCNQSSDEHSLSDNCETVEIPGVGTVCFFSVYDDDFSYSTHRRGSHTVDGPYLLVEPESSVDER
jgi:hypothetical protein